MEQKNKKRVKIIFTVLTIWLLFFSLAHFALAQVDLFGGQQTALGNALGLGAQDPRVTAAKIIQVALGFLGIIAVGLVLYGGWLWMTSAGDASKVERAKKLLISAGIGLLIILSAFGIVSFLLNSLLSATGAPGTERCTDGDTRSCGCSGLGTQTCTASSWGPCIGGACTPGIIPPKACDDLSLPEACNPLDSMCSPLTEYCSSSCLCLPTGGPGASCDADPNTTVCEPRPSMCAAYLQCDTGRCECDGAPVILWLSPVDIDGIPNGARRNFVTIGGLYFGAFAAGTSTVYFSDATGSTTVAAVFPNSVNAACTDNWTDTQIIVVVPDGAFDGPVRVVRGDGQQDDTTDAERGVQVNFEVNTTVRPGLCLADPSAGVFSDNFTLQGNNFSGASRDILFGNATASTSADNVSFVSSLTATATVPNLRAGSNTVYVSVAGENSNVLNFAIASDPNNDPFIDYIDPPDGPRGQYITIYGRNFKTYGTLSKVYFGTNEADTVFPEACQQWWRDRTIVVKVPDIPTGSYPVTVRNRLNRTSNPVDFAVTLGAPGPGLCTLKPHNGPVGMQVEAFGERFGATQGAGNAIFYNSVNASSISSWTDGQVSPLVPVGAETGRFIISDGISTSNSLNFTVGKCTPGATSATSPECDLSEDCCAGGNYDGICRDSGTCGDDTAGACTFAWTFTTTVSTTTPDSCRGYSGAAECINSGSCPNAPGLCQTSTTTISGACGQSYCDKISACGIGGCEYDPVLNKCKLSTATCNQTDSDLIGGYTAQCRRVGALNVWQINNAASCPTSTAMNSYRDPNGWCTVGSPGSPEECQLCPNGLTCQGGEAGATGECVINRNICPTGSSCELDPASTNYDKCIDSSGTCECCCRVDSSEADCCLGQICEAGGCGNDPAVYGQCIGCAVYIGGVLDQGLSDNACNCKPGGATRVCNTSVDTRGVCEDSPGPNGFCDDGGGGACSGGGICASATAYCDTDCRCKENTSLECDDNPAPSCQLPNNTTCTDVLGPDWECNPSTCLCRPVTVEVGTECQDEGAGICTEGVPSCGGDDYQCLIEPGVDCRCCCVPGDTKEVTSPTGDITTLTCIANKTPCASSDNSRGLFCGCTADTECEDPPESTGCSSIDACCHPRPAVIETETSPSGGEVCRNPLLSVTFDQEMDISSFSGKVIVVGDYGSNTCPAGTNYLTGGVYKKYDFFGKLWFNLKKYFGQNAQAIDGNFCAVTGLVKGYNNGDRGVLTFTPSAVLDENKDYYVIIKGDDLATPEVVEGVKSRFGVGMGNLPPVTSETFNRVPYQGYIWSFRTKEQTPTDDGICRLEYVSIEPVSYLFQTSENNIGGINDDLPGPDFDSVADRDKQFIAYAKSKAGENIVPVLNEYSWDWNWQSENESVARVSATSSPADITPATAMLEAQNKKDAKTYLKVSAKIMADSINNPSTKDKLKSAKAPIYVFICENPWPPVGNPAGWPWPDTGANCTQETDDCKDNNFELYYCRDKASVGSVNDLPAILVDPVVRGTPPATPTSNPPLKEIFFLRENLPDQTDLTVEPQSDGTRAYAYWPYVVNASSSKLYYGSASKSYTQAIEVINDTVSCPPLPAPRTCNVWITGLTTGRKYYFAVTSIFGSSKAESAASNEVTITPIDTQAPPIPSNFNASPADRAVDLSWDINSSSDIVGYYIYYGTAENSYGARDAVNKSTNQATITGLTNGVPYYFMLGAYDATGNEATTTATSTPN